MRTLKPTYPCVLVAVPGGFRHCRYSQVFPPQSAASRRLPSPEKNIPFALICTADAGTNAGEAKFLAAEAKFLFQFLVGFLMVAAQKPWKTKIRNFAPKFS